MPDERPTFGSLFAGIGGIDLGLERAGWRGRWQVENEPFCQRVLAKHWPDVQRYGDIHDVDWSGVEPVDLVAGGFPCQPFSLAGQRRGTDDDRWLWPEFARAIGALRPRLVLVENVPGLLAGRGMGAVLGDLADLGYDTEWESIPAAAVGAPHLRYRVWIVAHAHDLGGFGIRSVFDGLGEALRNDANGRGGSSDVADAAGDPRWVGNGNGAADVPNAPIERRQRLWRAWDGRPRPEDGGSRAWWATEPDVGRVAHGVPARVDRLRSLGNAVVPQVVEFIGRRILEAEALT